jgi:hypothetical protein
MHAKGSSWHVVLLQENLKGILLSYGRNSRERENFI